MKARIAKAVAACWPFGIGFSFANAVVCYKDGLWFLGTIHLGVAAMMWIVYEVVRKWSETTVKS